MARFHCLDVVDVRRETRDAVVVTLKPRDEDAALFDFTQGQYLTFRRRFDGEELRRSYSICAGKGDGFLQVGIKRVDGGAFSTWANEEPAGRRGARSHAADGQLPHRRSNPTRPKHYLGFAGGSGITPAALDHQDRARRRAASRASPWSTPTGRSARSCSARSSRT